MNTEDGWRKLANRVSEIQRLDELLNATIDHHCELRDGSDLSEDIWSAVRDGYIWPIFDILPRLWAKGWQTREQGGRWCLLDEDGEIIISGKTFRELCVDIVLAGV